MKYCKLSEIFDVSYGTKLDMNKMNISSDSTIAFVSRSSKNNGVVSYVDPFNGISPLSPGLITVTLGGSYLLSSFLQEKPFYTGQNVAVLSSKENLTNEEKLYYCLCIEQNRFRYSAFGREANRTLKDILIPSVTSIPKWVKQTNLSKFENAKASFSTNQTPSLVLNAWQPFRLNELFYIKKGKRLTEANMIKGKTPFIGAIDNNNGYRQFIGQQPIHEGNTITVNYNGSVAEAFYQPKPFWASDDVNVLYPKFKMNQYNALFIVTLIKQEKYRFNYGRKWHLGRMNTSEIKLPVNKKGNPDFGYMERYIKTLNYSVSI
jgi:hypothetical protein